MAEAILSIREEFYRAVEERITPAKDLYFGEDGIVKFVRDILCVENIAPYQEEILRAFVRERRIAVRGPHGLGKTALASWCIFWLMIVFETDVKVVTTASAWRQLEKYLWPEIHKWSRRAKWRRLGLDIRSGKELLALSFKLDGKEAFAVASDQPELIEGAHASVMGYIFDESKAIPDATFDAAEGALSQEGIEGKEVFVLAISTPGEKSGRFYDIHSRKQGFQDWWVRHVKIEEAIEAKQISETWVENRKLQWGEQSPVYQTRVLGEFADSGDENVISLSWVEAAIERWYDLGGRGTGKPSYGLDVARFGEDKTVLSKFVGNVLEWCKPFYKQDTMKTVGHVTMEIDHDTLVGVDTVGLGAGVHDRLVEMGYKSRSVNAGQATDVTDISGQNHFVDTRSAIWWMLRDRLNPDNAKFGDLLALPPEDKLIGDLCLPLWFPTSSGKIKVESKREIRDRLGKSAGTSGRSTDYADSVGIALWVAAVKNKKGGGNLR